jgi:Glycosyl hydrolases family 43
VSFLMSYFTTRDEALHLAVSRDGYRFAPLNGGAPVLRGEVGTRTLRDPFVAQGPDNLFHFLATDGWTSPDIVHATSPDLRTWSPQELIPVMRNVAGAHNAWAPEFFYDPASERYQLIWSSVVDPAKTSGSHWQDATQDHRIWGCVTEDFRTFSDAEMFFDPGFSVIDATVARDGDRFLMAFKDERGVNEVTTSHKHIMLTGFAKPGGSFDPPYGPVSPAPVEGPSLFRRDGAWVLIFDHFLEDRYGAASSRDGVTWSSADVTVPGGARHASVFPLASDSMLRFNTEELPS